MGKGVPSDPFLMTGFTNKMLHLVTDKAAAFEIEVDPRGDGTRRRYERVQVPAEGYLKHIFPQAFSAHWVRSTPLSDVTVSAEFMYT